MSSAEYQRSWRAAHPDRLASIRRRRYATDPIYRDRVREQNRRRDPVKWRAQNAVSYALRAGKLSRPGSCSSCGGGGFIEASHDDYSKPLEVDWLCRPCHRRKDHQ